MFIQIRGGGIHINDIEINQIDTVINISSLYYKWKRIQQQPPSNIVTMSP